ncbi:MAG TPA: glycosyltransferase family 39 protein, partial [Fimbriimonadaceae bacterium]|nr:glycosyltransferase family 39 protein [Fimbriimonadaceae bacterium]
MRPRTVLAILILAFVGLGLTYASITPYRQPGRLVHQAGALVPDIGAPDERQHANYVAHVLAGKGFPVLKPGSPDLIETYQSHQPPLYYVLASGWAKLTGADPQNPRSGSRIRWLSVLIGAGTLLGVYAAAKWGTGREEVALAAVAIAGLMPMFVALNSAVTNDPLAYFVCAWTFALCAKGLRGGWDWRLGALVGALVGVGLLTKTTCLALVPTAIAALVAAKVWTSQRPCLRTWLLVALLPFVVASPWMVRNTNLYG